MRKENHATQGGLNALVMGYNVDQAITQGLIGGALGGAAGGALGWGIKKLMDMGTTKAGNTAASKKPEETTAAPATEKPLVKGRPGPGLSFNEDANADEWLKIGNTYKRVSTVGGEELQIIKPSAPVAGTGGYIATGPMELIHGDAVSAGLATGWDVDLANTVSLGATVFSAGFGAKGLNSPVLGYVSMSLGFIGFAGSAANLYNDYQKGGGIKPSSLVDIGMNGGIAVLSVYYPGPGAGVSIGYSAFTSSPAGVSLYNKIDKVWLK